MKFITRKSDHIQRVLALLLLVSLVISNLSFVSAASLSNASLTLGDPRTVDKDSNPISTTYTVNASGFSTATAIACIDVNLNTQPDGSGAVPSGLTSTSSTFNSSSLVSDPLWTVNNTANGHLRITNAVTTETPAASGNVVWGNVTNGNTQGTTYYAIITTYTDVLCTSGNEVDTATMAFIYVDGTLVSLEISASLDFQVKAVASSQSVNGATTTVASTPSAINYGTMTSTSTNISAHDLQISTNAAGGYTVYIRQSSPLQNTGGNTIEWTASPGTNAAPAAFPAAGTEAWAYTTEDATLSTGSGAADRFTSAGGNKWAKFNTVNEEVFYNTVASAGIETTRVGHQIGISADTGAGTYKTTIIYTVVATY